MSQEQDRDLCNAAASPHPIWGKPHVLVCAAVSICFHVVLYGYGFISCRPGGNMWTLISRYEGGGMINMSGTWLALPLRLFKGRYEDLSNRTCGGTTAGRRPAPDWDTWVCYPTEDIRAQETYSIWKEGVPSLVAISAVFVTIGALVKDKWGVEGRIQFQMWFGMLVLLGAHGILGVVLLAAQSAANAALARAARRWPLRVAQASIWIFVLGCMELVFRFLGDAPHLVQGWESDQGVKFWSKLEGMLCGDDVLNQPASNGQLCRFSKPFVLKGLAPWFIFRFMALKLISYGLDDLWSFHNTPSGVRNLDAKPELVRRTETNLAREKYSLKYCIAYLGYNPLYISGPILSYNAFVSQADRPQKSYSHIDILRYGLQLLALMLFTEMFSVMWWYSQKLHTFSCSEHGESCILDDLPIWEVFLALHVRLMFMWMTLMIIWRFDRFVALLDGTDSPENMTGCVSFNYTFEAFWRIWHSSMNRFMLRYLYTPLGGKSNCLAVPTVFLFVAYWHENTGFFTRPWWYAWALMNALGVMVEKVLSDTLGKSLKAQALAGSRQAQVLQFFARGLGPLMMIFVNVPALFFDTTFKVYRSLLLQGWRSASMFSILLVVFGCNGLLIDAVEEGKSSKPQPPVAEHLREDVPETAGTALRSAGVELGSFSSTQEGEALA